MFYVFYVLAVLLFAVGLIDLGATVYAIATKPKENDLLWWVLVTPALFFFGAAVARYLAS